MIFQNLLSNGSTCNRYGLVPHFADILGAVLPCLSHGGAVLYKLNAVDPKA
jgi:hypothetical protein